MIRLIIVPGIRERELEAEIFEGVYVDMINGVTYLTVDGQQFAVTSNFIQDAESLEAFVAAVRMGMLEE